MVCWIIGRIEVNQVNISFAILKRMVSGGCSRDSLPCFASPHLNVQIWTNLPNRETVSSCSSSSHLFYWQVNIDPILGVGLSLGPSSYHVLLLDYMLFVSVSVLRKVPIPEEIFTRFESPSIFLNFEIKNLTLFFNGGWPIISLLT